MRQMAMNIIVKEYYLMAMDSETYLMSLWSLCGVTSLSVAQRAQNLSGPY